jgi:hypothetical protein
MIWSSHSCTRVNSCIILELFYQMHFIISWIDEARSVWLIPPKKLGRNLEHTNYYFPNFVDELFELSETVCRVAALVWSFKSFYAIVCSLTLIFVNAMCCWHCFTPDLTFNQFLCLVSVLFIFEELMRCKVARVTTNSYFSCYYV